MDKQRQKDAGRFRRVMIVVIAALILVSFFGYFIFRKYFSPTSRTKLLISWLKNPKDFSEAGVEIGSQCHDSVFLMPTSGFIGYLWDDSFKLGISHQGIDIFAATDVGETPVIVAYNGYLTRHQDWKSSVIIRIPEDPLKPERQIWIYYTHMADAQGNSLIDEKFKPGVYEVPISAGTHIGYQGNYSGSIGNPVGVHLHFSIVRDDGNGNFLNELKIGNTVDPTPYFNLPLNARENTSLAVVCSP